MITAGIDIGSRCTKAVVLRDGKIIAAQLNDTAMRDEDRGRITLRQALDTIGLDEKELDFIVATGYGRVNAPFAHKTVTEITCHAGGIFNICPGVRTVIDIGGQDSKVIKLNDSGGVEDFNMNDRCAAGTGKFLEVTSHAMSLDLADFSKLYFSAQNPCKISSTCTVFAESEVISLLAGGNTAQDIVAGLILSVSRRIGNMAKKLKVSPQFAFTGGVAKNIAVKSALEKELGLDFVKYDFDPQLVGAYGAAIIARGQAEKSR